MDEKYLKYVELINKILSNPNNNLEKQEKELAKELLKDCLNQTNFGEKTKVIFKTMIDTAEDFRQLYFEMQTYASSNNLYL